MRKEKQFLLDEIDEKMKGSKGFVVTRYKGFTALRAREFRDLVQGAQAEFEVVRKRLFFKALEQNNSAMDTKDFEGHIGVVFAKEDPVKVAKLVFDFGASNDQALELIGGVIEGETLSGEEIIAISKLPPLEQLRASFLGLLEAPMGSLLSLFEAPHAQVLHCLDERSKQENL